MCLPERPSVYNGRAHFGETFQLTSFVPWGSLRASKLVSDGIQGLVKPGPAEVPGSRL